MDHCTDPGLLRHDEREPVSVEGGLSGFEQREEVCREALREVLRAGDPRGHKDWKGGYRHVQRAEVQPTVSFQVVEGGLEEGGREAARAGNQRDHIGWEDGYQKVHRAESPRPVEGWPEGWPEDGLLGGL